MKKSLILAVALVMTVGFAVADSNETDDTVMITEEVPDDIGMFSADHPLHFAERGMDSVSVAVGLANHEDIADKRMAEANDIAQRGDEVDEEVVEKVMERVDNALENIPDDSPAHDRVGGQMNRIGDNLNNSMGEVPESVSERMNDVSERANQISGGVNQGEADYEIFGGNLVVEGEVTVPHTGFDVVSEEISVDEENNTVDVDVEVENDASENNARGGFGQVLTDREFEVETFLEEGTYDIHTTVTTVDGEDETTDVDETIEDIEIVHPDKEVTEVDQDNETQEMTVSVMNNATDEEGFAVMETGDIEVVVGEDEVEFDTESTEFEPQETVEFDLHTDDISYDNGDIVDLQVMSDNYGSDVMEEIEITFHEEEEDDEEEDDEESSDDDGDEEEDDDEDDEEEEEEE